MRLGLLLYTVILNKNAEVKECDFFHIVFKVKSLGAFHIIIHIIITVHS